MRKHLKLIVSLVLVSSVALAGAISVEVGGYQYLKGLVLTAASGEEALKLTSGAKVCLNAACSGSIQEISTVVTIGNSLQSPSVTGTITDSNALTVGASAAGPGRAFILSEATDNTPTIFTTNHAVVGRATASGAGSGALFMQYNSSDNSSLIGSLSPAVAWRTLRLAASTVVAQDPAGVAQLTITNATGALQTNGTVTSNGLTVGGDINLNTGFSLGVLGSSYIHNSVVGYPIFVLDAEGFAITGVATGSLATCNNTAPGSGGTRGTWQYDTTTSTMKYCNGTAWQNITPDTDTNTWEGKLGGFWPNQITDGSAYTFAQVKFHKAARTTSLYWTPTATGVGAGNVTITVRNVTTATNICAPTVACTTAAFTATALICASGNIAVGDEIAIQYTGACSAAGNPTGNATLGFTE